MLWRSLGWMGLFTVLAVAPAAAVTAETWSASTAEQLATGTLDGTALDRQGRVRLAPQAKTLWGPDKGVAWAVAPAERGAAFVALSGPGRVLRVAAAAEPQVWFRSDDESLVTALVPGEPGEVFLGVSPEGRVARSRLSPVGEAEVETVLETGALFVWALARESDGTLWVGTGLPGRLLRHTSGGTIETLFDAGDDPVRSIALLPGGGVVIGTGGRGRVVRIDPDGTAFVLFDAEEAEIVSVAAGESGTVFALAAASAKRPAGKPQAAATPNESNSVRVVATPPPDNGSGNGKDAAPERPAPPARPGPALVTRPGGALYRIEADGGTQRIWTTGGEMPFALALGTGRLLVATGDSGRVHALDFDGRATELQRVGSDQASALALATDGSVLVGGTTDARVERLGPGPRAEGRYLTAAVDAGAVADWGRLRWEADVPRGSKLRVHARAGNTAEPDDTWSAWAELDAAAGEATADSQLPATRWFQARFTFESRGEASPSLRQVEIAYQPRNRTPVIESLSVAPTGVVWVRGPVQSSVFQGPLVAEDPVARKISDGLRPKGRRPAAIRRAYEPGARTFSWKAGDPDRDRLRYTLEIRRDGEEEWYVLARDLADSFLSWDARGMPDGLYRVRLSADDTLDNPNGTHRAADRVSDGFRIDNTRPRVENLDVRRTDGEYEVRFVARDEGGSVAAVEVAVDGGAWKPLSPLDGVADSDLESYRFVLPRTGAPDDAARSLIVRAIDASGNLGGEMWSIAP